jgi:hypothetical protein
MLTHRTYVLVLDTLSTVPAIALVVVVIILVVGVLIALHLALSGTKTRDRRDIIDALGRMFESIGRGARRGRQ